MVSGFAGPWKANFSDHAPQRRTFPEREHVRLLDPEDRQPRCLGLCVYGTPQRNEGEFRLSTSWVFHCEDILGNSVYSRISIEVPLASPTFGNVAMTIMPERWGERPRDRYLQSRQLLRSDHLRAGSGSRKGRNVRRSGILRDGARLACFGKDDRSRVDHRQISRPPPRTARGGHVQIFRFGREVRTR